MSWFLQKRLADPRFQLGDARPNPYEQLAATYDRVVADSAPPTPSVTDAPTANPASTHPLHVERSNASRRCWKGYEATPGKEPYSEGSCRKSTGDSADSKKKKRKKKKEKTSKTSGEKSSSSSSSSEGEDGDKKKKRQKK
jgi:hypothetical protein